MYDRFRTGSIKAPAAQPGDQQHPPKVCTYSCVYCHLGWTVKMQVGGRAFYEPEEVLRRVQQEVGQAREIGETIDHLTFVPDGEPPWT